MPVKALYQMQFTCPSHEVIKDYSFSTLPSMNFILLINVKMPVVGILTFICRINVWLWWFKPENSINFGSFNIYEQP